MNIDARFWMIPQPSSRFRILERWKEIKRIGRIHSDKLIVRIIPPIGRKQTLDKELIKTPSLKVSLR
ncbi:hypothetical protein GHK01_32660 [Sinorhizobium meliloti]|uniref:hypothetical protein n=1 Tax=Rhizobium meliloti TaxID=382 RepID=UPI001297D352|nr:hypothetical protein [Sinorhizobium meliloti]MQV31210.1 hypothetical protein [Sinorhizobium meliloti]